MGAEEALDLTDRLIFEATNSHFNDLQRAIFKQAWMGETYEAIANELGYSEGYVKDLGSELWSLLTQALGEQVSKINFRAAIERKQRSLQRQPITSSNQLLDSTVNTSTTSEIPSLLSLPFEDETRWIGRTELIADLIQRLKADCRIVSLVGITGIGKTSLATKLKLEMEASQSYSRYEFISFDAELSSFERIVRLILGEWATKDEKLQREPNLLVGTLIAKLKAEPCLLVLDMLEDLLEGSEQGRPTFREQIFSQFLDSDRQSRFDA